MVQARNAIENWRVEYNTERRCWMQGLSVHRICTEEHDYIRGSALLKPIG
jgi:hypothetical protein